MPLLLVQIKAMHEITLEQFDGNPRKRQRLATGADGRKQLLGVCAQQYEKSLSGGLLQCLEQGVGRCSLHLFGFFDQADLAGAFQGAIGKLSLDGAYLLDLDVIAVRLKQMQIRMIEMIDLAAGYAISASATFAEDGPHQRKRHQSLADPVRPAEKIGVSQAAGGEHPAENVFLPVMAENAGEGHPSSPCCLGSASLTAPSTCRVTSCSGASA